MAIWYVDSTRPDDSGAGTSWGTAKKNMSGVTAAAGDTIRVAKSTTSALTGTLTWTDGSLTVSTSNDLTASLAAKQMISPSADGSQGWYEIASITSTTITLAYAFAGTTGSYSSVKVNPVDLGSVSTATTVAITYSGGGSAGSTVQVIGGWNTTSGLRDGETHYWVSGTNRNGIFEVPAYTDVSYIHLHRMYRAFNLAAGRAGVSFTNCGAHAASNYGFYLAGLNASLTSNSTTGGSNGYFCSGGGYTLASCTARSPSTYGFYSTAAMSMSLATCSMIRCPYGVVVLGSARAEVVEATMEQCTYGIYSTSPVRAASCSINGGLTALVSASGTLHASECTLTGQSSVEYQAITGGIIQIDRHDAVAGDHRRVDQCGEVRRHATAGRGGSAAVEMRPSITADNLTPLEQSWPIPCKSGEVRTITAWLQRTVDWNGASVKIGIRRLGQWVATPAAVSVNSNGYVQASTSVTTSADEGVELVVMTDGTAGSIFVDSVAWS